MEIMTVPARAKRLPSLDGYDAKRPRSVAPGTSEYLPTDVVFGGFDGQGASMARIASYVSPEDWANNGLLSQLSGERTHSRDRAVLVAYGVDGSVPLAVARARHGLDAPVADNDNVPQALAAAA
jgi:hypothetical protein